MKRVLQSCSLLVLLCAATAHAQLYKWVGPDGKVTYSDVPPTKSAARVETKSLTTDGVSTSDLPFEVAEAMRNQPVTLYTGKNCPPCEEGRKLLSERGIPFAEKTVSSNEDIAQFRQAGGDNQLPLLVVGRNKERGYEFGAWNRLLSSAGYPETSRLPKSYRNPPAQAAAPQAAAPEKQESTAPADRAAALPRATDLPPPTGNAPPGFRF
ncbi:MAG TPA: glutaredoxin family protein [Noviherbaspirillum sp.]|uniref:glutaredoxin family protein n=1 Tax=Noviherbaspirillum sp. TaxID=1926288 RepID=UPI002D5CC183|nr:glutaredoxin family protein [Noviherbaspirillum sp.]HYD97532.1 glutaredoxin family protein [Noviherbaspirillum sp.]